LADAEKFDVDERLRQYAEEIRAEDELSRFQESRRNLSDAVEHTLQLQKEHELIMANTAAERLAIEQKYQNLLAARHGIEVSPAEKDEQSKHRNLEASNEALSQWRSGASQFRDMVADSMENGTTSGFLRALKSAAFRRLATTITNGLLGANLGNDGDIFGVFKGKPKTLAADVKTPGVAQSSTSGAPTKLSSIVEQTRGRNRLQLAPEIAASILPKSLRRAAQGEGGVGSGESLNLENATFNIQNATEYVQTATINTSGTRAGGSSGSAGSGPSNEQMAGKIFGLFT
jgi:hypothetical protein